jgi:hypothetical protein
MQMMDINQELLMLDALQSIQRQVHLLTLSQVHLWTIAALAADNRVIWQLCHANADRLLQSIAPFVAPIEDLN